MSNNKGNNSKYFEIIPHGTITSVPEFYAASCHCGIRKWKEDICIIYTPLNTCTSGVFTTNKFAAAPVLINRDQLDNNRDIKAIIINSGISNACTGDTGIMNAKKTIELAGNYLNIKKENILISSTGRIGEQLPMEKIERGIKYCSKNLNADGGHHAAKAILTIDKHAKEIAVKIKINNCKDLISKEDNSHKEIIIGGIAKGSVMIEPNMATTLAFISTNIGISEELLDDLLLHETNNSFNCITTDGCQSTNDMVIIQANGQSGIEIKNKGDKYFDKFKSALFFVLETLAYKVIEDSEGATKVVEINVVGAKDKIEAKEIGKKIANSILFKTAIFGEDLNWGRVAAAIGSIDNHIDQRKVDIYIGEVLLMGSGVAVDYDSDHANRLIKNKCVGFTINLNSGNGRAKVLTSDISYEYIKINSLYRKQK